MHKHLQVLIVIACVFGCTRSKEVTKTDTGKEIHYNVSSDIFPNPERGFIHNIESHSGTGPLVADQLASLRAENVSMILRLYYLENFKTTAISDAELALIQSDFALIREAGIKCVLRFAYTDDMAGTDASLAIINQHLDQLKPILEQNRDVIAFVQAGLIGAWGEWHSSSNGLATVENEKAVIDKWLSVLPPDIMVQVRTPGQKQQIVGTTEPVSETVAYTNDKAARIGHHNDCFMASVDDYGTYTNVQADKAYISKEGLYVPTGGETCPPDPPSSMAGCPDATSTMKLLRWTYLNLDWYKPVIDAWRQAGCFDELQRNLGYRLALETAVLPDKVKSGSDLNVKISITNVGYAPLYNYKNAALVFKNKATGEFREFALDVDVRKCKPMGKLKIEQAIKTTDLASGMYDLFLKISDKSETLKSKSAYSVRLANADVWVEEDGGINNLNHQLQITE